MADNTVQKAGERFLKNQFFLASWAAAVRHNKTWNQITEQEDRAEFKQNIQAFLETMLASYKGGVSSEAHTQNIVQLQEKSAAAGERLNIGTCQKLLNLLCKYYWCAGWIAEPPHFPIDRRVLASLLINANWTDIDDIPAYTKIIEQAAAQTGEKSPAQWELSVWNGESDTKEAAR